MNTNHDVIVQRANKPQSRRVVGLLTRNYQPDRADLSRWDVVPDTILEQKWKRFDRRWVYFIITV